MKHASTAFMVERKRVTCPETGHLEEVAIEHTPLGHVVTGCSRYRTGQLRCPRECARRMDRRDRMNVDDRERVLIIAHLESDVGRIATILAEELAADGLAVELAELAARARPPIVDYDAIVVDAASVALCSLTSPTSGRPPSRMC